MHPASTPEIEDWDCVMAKVGLSSIAREELEYVIARSGWRNLLEYSRSVRTTDEFRYVMVALDSLAREISQAEIYEFGIEELIASMIYSIETRRPVEFRECHRKSLYALEEDISTEIKFNEDIRRIRRGFGIPYVEAAYRQAIPPEVEQYEDQIRRLFTRDHRSIEKHDNLDGLDYLTYRLFALCDFHDAADVYDRLLELDRLLDGEQLTLFDAIASLRWSAATGAPIMPWKLPEVCSICLETVGSNGEHTLTEPCEHAFCAQCIDGWLEQDQERRSCPNCKQTVESLRNAMGEQKEVAAPHPSSPGVEHDGDAEMAAELTADEIREREERIEARLEAYRREQRELRAAHREVTTPEGTTARRRGVAPENNGLGASAGEGEEAEDETEGAEAEGEEEEGEGEDEEQQPSTNTRRQRANKRRRVVLDDSDKEDEEEASNGAVAGSSSSPPGLGPLGSSSPASPELDSELDSDGPAVVQQPERNLPKSTDELLLAIAEDDFGVSPDRSSTLASPAMKALRKAAKARGLDTPEAARQHGRGMELPVGYVIVKAPNGLDESCTDGGKTLKIVSYLLRMRLVAAGSLLESTSFRHGNRVMELVTETSLIARRHIALNLTTETISALRRKVTSESRDWQLLQRSLHEAGIQVCPLSGVPVVNIDACSPELREALWGALVAMRDVSNGATDGFEAAMTRLGELVSAAPPAAPAGDGSGSGS